MEMLSPKKMAVLGLAAGIIFALAVIAVFFGWSAPAEPPEGIEETPAPAPMPGEKIELIELTKKDCKQCLSFEAFKQQLSDLNREFTLKEIDFESEEGMDLIEEYVIEFVPTIILKNAPADLFGNWEDAGSVEEDGALVFRAEIPAYWSLEEQRLIGLVDVTEIIDSSCAGCFDPLLSQELQLLLANIKVGEARGVEAGSAEGKALLKKHHLGFAPAVVFSSEIRDYNFFDQFAPLGSVENDGSFVVRSKYPPYKDLDSNTVKGLLAVTVIEATQCWACKDSKDLLGFLSTSLGLRFSDVSVIDVNTPDALSLSEQYSVQFAPAALIAGDLLLYPGMEETWPQIGRVFTDGVYAFDNPLLLGEGYYYDLNTAEIITVSARPADANAAESA